MKLVYLYSYFLFPSLGVEYLELFYPRENFTDTNLIVPAILFRTDKLCH